MYKNRLVELTRMTNKVGSKLQDPLVVQPEGAEDNDFETGVARTEKLLELIEGCTVKMEAYKNDFNTAKDNKVSSQVTKKMQRTVDANNGHITQLKQELQNLARKIDMLDKANKQANSAVYKSVILKYGNLVQRSQTVLGKSRSAQEEFKSSAKNTINRHINIINKELSESQKQEISLNPEKLETLLSKKLNSNVSTNLINSVSDIENKYKDILSLEKTINECLQLMQDLAILVQYQGEQINRIEVMLIDTSDFVNNGQTKLVEAKKHYKSGNKKICWIIMLVVFGLAVILIPVLITQLK